MARKTRNKSITMNSQPLHLMLLPGILILLIFSYFPMFGLTIAFSDFDISLGIKGFWASEWVGFEHFIRFFSDPDATRAIVNTIQIAFMKIATMFVVPLAISLMLNEVKVTFVKRIVQTLVYLPHFLSWVILAGIVRDIFAGDGLVNSTLNQLFGMEPYFWLGDKQLFPHLLVWTNVWKEFGFSTIVYLAAISGINVELYEAAIVDGANRWQQTVHVTLPGMTPIIVLVLVLALGRVLDAGFDQVFNLYSVPVRETGDIIDTLVYRLAFQGGQYSFSTAVGLFKSVVSCIFISLSYWLARKYANYEIF